MALTQSMIENGAAQNPINETQELQKKDEQINYYYSFDRFDMSITSKVSDEFFKKLTGNDSKKKPKK